MKTLYPFMRCHCQSWIYRRNLNFWHLSGITNIALLLLDSDGKILNIKVLLPALASGQLVIAPEGFALLYLQFH